MEMCHNYYKKEKSNWQLFIWFEDDAWLHLEIIFCQEQCRHNIQMCFHILYIQSLIPDIKPSLDQEEVVDLHPEEPALSGAEDEDHEDSDQNLQIRRTVTQVILQPIPSINQMNY